MKIDGKRIIKEVKDEKSDRGKVMLYLSKGLYRDFKVRCGEGNASKVLERLMRAFIDSLKE